MPAEMNRAEAYIMQTLHELARDWDYDEPITANTGLFGQLGLESLDAVILATAIQEHYGCQMPFPKLFADVGERQQDLTVGQLIEFVERHAGGAPAAHANGSGH